MLKACIGPYYFEQNYNCAESVLRAANDYYQLGLHDYDMKLVGAFGAGIQCGNTCGAILSAASVLSMKYVEAKAHESADIKPVTTAMMEKLVAKYGSALCNDIKPQSFQPEIRCLKTVEAVCDILEETIAEFEAAKAMK